MFKLIAGPCVIESEKTLFQAAETMLEISQGRPVDYYFKASFDKANRTSIRSYRGPGLKKGLEMLERVKHRFGLRIATDIHEPAQAEAAAAVADILQIPAFLCRQTDLLLAAGKTGKLINIKKGQFLAPEDMRYIIQKLEDAGESEIWLCERGTSFGYHALVVDMTGIAEMKKFGRPVIMDATHSVQKPGGNDGKTSGNRAYIEPLAKAAVAAGADGLFLEVHHEPDQALSDGPNMLKLSEVDSLLKKVLRIYEAVNADGF